MEFVLTGKKGNGKGIIGLKLIEKYLLQGKPVATNLNLYLEHLLPPESKTFVYRLPDQPSAEDLEIIGVNPTGGDETKNGLIILDECLSWLNSRDYKDKERKKLIDWFVHSRKFGWDVVYIIQSIESLDKQFRDNFAEHLINVQRLDRLPIPIIGGLISMAGFAARMPRIHVGTVRYGTAHSAPVVERIYARGKRFWKCYDTLQKFTPMNEFQGVSCTLPAWHVSGRYKTWWQMYKTVMGGSLFSGLALGLIISFSALMFMGYKKPPSIEAGLPVVSAAKVTGYYLSGGNLTATISDGRVISTSSFKQTSKGVVFTVGNEIFEEASK